MQTSLACLRHHHLKATEVLGRVKGKPSAAAPPLTRPALLCVMYTWAMADGCSAGGSGLRMYGV